MDIHLSEDRGINPRMTVCTQCGGEAPSLLLLGDGDYLHDCSLCGKKVLGKKRIRKCPACKESGGLTLDRRLDEYEKIPAGYCEACKKKNREMNQVVKDGGVFWRCVDCGSEGAIRGNSQLAKAVRKKANVQPPDPVGVEFSKKDHCPVCSEENE